jgi:hypothetical protein
MSIANLEEPNNFGLYASSLDTTTSSLKLGFVTAPRIDIGNPLTPVFINGVAYNPGITPVPVTPQTLAFFSGSMSSSISDTSITVDGTNNSLLFQPLGAIAIDTIDSVGGTDQLLLGTETNNTVVLSQPGQNTQIAGNAEVDGVLSVNTIQSSNEELFINSTGAGNSVSIDSPQDVIIGPNNAMSIDIGRPGIPVNIFPGATLMVSNIDSSNPPVTLFPSVATVTCGASGSNFIFNGGISFTSSGASQINYYATNLQSTVMGSGPIPTQTIGVYSVQRLNNMVTLNIRWNIAPQTVTTPGTILTLTPSLLAPYIPTNTQFFSCLVRTIITSFELGKITIDNTGGITVVPASTTTWSAGLCDFGSISVIYDVTI